jgi:hypothetical protein
MLEKLTEAERRYLKMKLIQSSELAELVKDQNAVDICESIIKKLDDENT